MELFKKFTCLFILWENKHYKRWCFFYLLHLKHLKNINHPAFTFFKENISYFNEEKNEAILSYLARSSIKLKLNEFDDIKNFFLLTPRYQEICKDLELSTGSKKSETLYSVKLVTKELKNIFKELKEGTFKYYNSSKSWATKKSMVKMTLTEDIESWCSEEILKVKLWDCSKSLKVTFENVFHFEDEEDLVCSSSDEEEIEEELDDFY